MSPEEKEALKAEIERANASYKFEEEKYDSTSYAYLQYLQGHIDGLMWVQNHLEYNALELASKLDSSVQTNGDKKA